MKKLKIEKAKKGNDTITRTIRISGKTFDKINVLKCLLSGRSYIGDGYKLQCPSKSELCTFSSKRI